MVLLIAYFFFDDMGFLNCHSNCTIPGSNKSGVFLLIRFFVFIIPIEYSWYIFYIIPRDYNALLITSRSTNVDFKYSEDSQFNDDEMALIGELKLNMDPIRNSGLR